MTEEISKETTEQENDVKEPDQDPGQKVPEKITLTQKELDGRLADARRKAESAYKDLQKKHDDLLTSIEAKEKAANEAAAEKVEALRKDLPEPLIKLLDNLSPVAQLEWLNDPANTITKKEIPPLPQSRETHGGQKKSINIV